MKCIHCNTPIAENARFCPKCGLPVSTEPSEAPTGNEQTISMQEVEKISSVTGQQEQAEQSVEREESASTPTISKNGDVTSIEQLPKSQESSFSVKESKAAPDIVELAEMAEEEVSSASSTDETIEVAPLARALAEAEAKAEQKKAQASTADELSTLQTSPLSPESAGKNASQTVARNETPRIPGRPRAGQGAKPSAYVPPRPGAVSTSPAPISARPNAGQVATPSVSPSPSIPSSPVPPRLNAGQVAAPSVSAVPSSPIPSRPNAKSVPASQAPSASPTSMPARARQSSARFLPGTQDQQEEQDKQESKKRVPQQLVASPESGDAPASSTAPVAEQTLTSLPTMPLEAMPPLPSTPYTPQRSDAPPLSPSPTPSTPLIPPEMPIAPERYFQGQPFSSQRRPGVINMQQTKRSRTRRGCLPGFLVTLVLLVVLVAAGWLFVARPYLHAQAVAQIDQAMTAEVNQLPTFLPVPGGLVRVTDAMLTNMLALSLPSNIPIQNAQVQINSGGLQISFQTEGLPSSITGVPVVSQEHLLLSQVAVKGVASLILSAKDIASLCNQHIAAALARIHHTVSSVRLLNHEMDLVLS
jgi:hypothetical protein